MKLTITIKMDNAAFEPLNGTEAARILRAEADKCIDGHDLRAGWEHDLRDTNGNVIGKATVTG
jgi:hypothetical protein